MTTVEIVTISATAFTAIIAGIALGVAIFTYRQQHVVRNDLKLRISPPQLEFIRTNNLSKSYVLVDLKLAVFNLGNRPTIVEWNSVGLSYGDYDDIVAAGTDWKVEGIYSVNKLKTRATHESPAAKVRPSVVEPRNVFNLDCYFPVQIHTLLESEDHVETQGLLFLNASFLDAEGNYLDKKIPFAVFKSEVEEGKTRRFFLATDPFKKTNELIKIF